MDGPRATSSRYPPNVLTAGLLFLLVIMVIWIFAVILGLALRFRHLLRRDTKKRQP